METLIERCQRICKNGQSHCSINNKEQIVCISDMVLAKIGGIKELLESIAEANQCSNEDEILTLASKDIDELIVWVKLLQVAQDLRTLIKTKAL